LFGTYVRRGEWLLYPFYELSKNGDEEYEPEELGFNGRGEFTGEQEEQEHIIYVAYGLTDRLMVELEGELHARATLRKGSGDTSGMPDKLEESGLGDVEAQARWRWSAETSRRPELFSFFEMGYPFQSDKVLIGTQEWELGLGLGAIKGFRWGTVTGRVSLGYEGGEGGEGLELGEYAVEYLKRATPVWRFVGAIEGEDDEVELVVEAQAHLSDRIFIKLNSGFGLTAKASDFAPEVGVVFSF